MFHAWQFDMRGNCVYVAREKEGYQDRFSKDDAGLRRLRCVVNFGGFVWVNMNDQPITMLDEWAGAALNAIEKTNWDVNTIDLIVLATSTPHDLFGSAPSIQAKLGASNAVAFDLTAACSGFLFALITASQFLKGGNFKRAVVCLLYTSPSPRDY